MIINGKSLLNAYPIKDMLESKIRNSNGLSYGLTESGYDIRLKQRILFYSINGVRYHSVGNRIKLGHFALGSSIECFNMPDYLFGQVMNKSSWARLGLDASLTTNIEPGWNGHLTIELVYNGYTDLDIPAGSPICSVIFHQIYEFAKYKGQYNQQADKPVESKIKL